MFPRQNANTFVNNVRTESSRGRKVFSCFCCGSDTVSYLKQEHGSFSV